MREEIIRLFGLWDEEKECFDKLYDDSQEFRKHVKYLFGKLREEITVETRVEEEVEPDTGPDIDEPETMTRADVPDRPEETARLGDAPEEPAGDSSLPHRDTGDRMV